MLNHTPKSAKEKRILDMLSFYKSVFYLFFFLSVRASTRKWIQKRQRNNCHDLHSKAASREMPGIEHGPLHDLCCSYQSILHSQSRGSLENYGEVWLSDQVHSLHRSKMMVSFLIHSLWQMVSSNAVSSPNSVQHDVLCHAHRCFPGWWQWHTY